MTMYQISKMTISKGTTTKLNCYISSQKAQATDLKTSITVKSCTFPCKFFLTPFSLRYHIDTSTNITVQWKLYMRPKNLQTMHGREICINLQANKNYSKKGINRHCKLRIPCKQSQNEIRCFDHSRSNDGEP